MNSVDVIIPAYLPTKNHHELLRRSIRSLEKQTFKGFGVIVVLNGCYTDYGSIIESVKTSLDIKWLTIEGKASGAIARNKGIKHSNKKYIAQLDADDQYHPDKLKKQIEYFQENPKVSFVGTLALDWHSDEKQTDSCYKVGQYEDHMSIARGLLRENIMCHGSIMFRRDHFLQLDGYNEKNKPGELWPGYERKMWEDWDLWKRAVQSGYRFYNIPERLYYWSTNTGVER
jgi:glycosyltransferase involved in cell wall biosynthesis